MIGACGENRKVVREKKRKSERGRQRGREKSLGDPDRGEENVVGVAYIRLLGGRKWPRRLPFWNSRTRRHVNFLRGKVCYEEADTNQSRKKGNIKCTRASEIDEVADEKDTAGLFSRLFVHHRSVIAYPSTPLPFVFGNRRKRKKNCTRHEYFYIYLYISNGISFCLERYDTIKLNFYYRDCIRYWLKSR